MDNYVNRYCKLLMQLEDYKKKIINLGNKQDAISNRIYLKYMNDIEDLLFEKYMKLELIIKETNKK